MVTRLDPATDIDWDDDFIWVQRAPVLTVLERSAGWVHVRHPKGGEITLTRTEAESQYFPMRDGSVLKPRYAPVKAHSAQVATKVELPCGTVRLDEGDVLLCDDGAFRIVRSAIFDRDYVSVAYPGTKDKPSVPFAESA